MSAMREASFAGGLDAVFQEVEGICSRQNFLPQRSLTDRRVQGLGHSGMCYCWLTKASLGLMEQKFMVKLQL